MFLRSLHRMILADLLKVFALTLIALTGLILLAGVVAEAMKSGLSPAQILVVIPLLAPSLLPYTIPTTTLFATCVVYGRLSADNELLAVKAAGVHVVHVIWPALLLGTLASALTFFLSLDVIPHTNFLLRNQIGADVEEVLYGLLRRDGCIRHPKINYEIDVKEVQGRKLLDVIFKRRAAGGAGFDVIARAKEAELQVDLSDRQILVRMRYCQLIQTNGEGVLETHTWPIDLPSDLTRGGGKLRACDMTWSELGDYAATYVNECERITRDIEFHETALGRKKGAPHYAKHVQDLVNERKILTDQLIAIDCETHTRPAFALGCLCFALVGCPIGIWFSKSDYLSAFITCFLPIVGLYYPLMLCMINLARAGQILPWLGAYDADIVMLLTGMLLFWRLARN